MALINVLFSWFGRPGEMHSLTVDGLKRTYFVHVPSTLDTNKPAALVVALHGATMNAPMMSWFTGLNEIADRSGFIVVYPNGTGSHFSFTWNAGNCCGPAMQNKVDDVAFIRAMLDDVSKVHRVDQGRVFATGISNGAVMAYRLASELADRFAAIAPVAGPMGTETTSPSRPVSVLHFHGTEDEFAPYVGGVGPKSIFRSNFFSVEHSVHAWMKANGCNETPTIEELAIKVDDGTRVTRSTYAGGRDGSEVTLVTIHGGGHTWPGRPARQARLRRATMNVSANDLMWEFFQRHRRPG